MEHRSKCGCFDLSHIYFFLLRPPEDGHWTYDHFQYSEFIHRMNHFCAWGTSRSFFIFMFVEPTFLCLVRGLGYCLTFPCFCLQLIKMGVFVLVMTYFSRWGTTLFTQEKSGTCKVVSALGGQIDATGERTYLFAARDSELCWRQRAHRGRLATWGKAYGCLGQEACGRVQ